MLPAALKFPPFKYTSGKTMAHYETETLTECPVCGASAAERVLAVPDAHMPELNLHRCAACGIVYLNPRLAPAGVIAVETASESYRYSAEETETVIAKLQEVAAWLETQTGGAGRILDIGCNRGFLLEAARRRGWHPVGIEIAESAAAEARSRFGLAVYGSLDELPPSAQFDAIVIWHTLEHTSDPAGLLRQAAAHLAPRGVIALQVPSFEYLEEFRRRDRLGGLVCSVHNFYFTLATLPTVVERAGLQVIASVSDPGDLTITALCGLPPQLSGRSRIVNLARTVAGRLVRRSP